MTRLLKMTLAAMISSAMVLQAQAGSGDIPAKKQTMAGLYLRAAEAAAMLRDRTVLFVDVRTRAEVAFLGLPTRADVNIPFRVMPAGAVFNSARGTYALEPNEDFGDMLLDFASARGIRPDTPIVLICRSGSRSARAADVLTAMGFTQVYSVVDGYEGDIGTDGFRNINGWRNAGLDWSYRIARGQVYPGDV